MVRQLGEMGAELVAVPRLDRVDDQPVQPHAADAREPVVEGVADEDVCESEATGAAGRVGDDTCGQRLVQRLEHLVARRVVEQRERVELELATEHRRQQQHAVAVGREVGETAGDDVADGLRDREPALVRDALDGEEADDLGDEERIAVGVFVQGPDEPRGRRAGDAGQLDVLGELAPAQSGEREPARHRLPREFGQRL